VVKKYDSAGSRIAAVPSEAETGANIKMFRSEEQKPAVAQAAQSFRKRRGKPTRQKKYGKNSTQKHA
jgi:hypothetical protein